MKRMFNLTTDPYDLARYASREHFLSTLEGFDGVELMYIGKDERGVVPKEKVVGYHTSFPACWLNFWRGDTQRLLADFDTMDKARTYYGGHDRRALVKAVRREYDRAVSYGAAYLVFHAADYGFWECVTGDYIHSDEEVVDALCDLLDRALPMDPDGPILLLENLWGPGLTFTRPAITARLLAGVKYPRTGFMLDTGHLMHMEPALRSQKEALTYLHRCLDEHGELCRFIKGVHLHQSITGPYVKRVRRHLPDRPETWEDRMDEMFRFVFNMDLHKPFVCPGVGELIDRIAPDYLTFEFISNDLPELRRMLRRQANALK